MLEYEFRLVVLDPNAFALLEIQQQPKKIYKVIYAKPHFRFKNNCWECKKLVSQVIVYHDTFWFRWVISKELPFKHWTKSLHTKFIDSVGFFQNPFQIEYRVEIQLDEQAKIYAFRKGKETGIVFEYETLNDQLDVTPLNNYNLILNVFFRNKTFPEYTLKPCIRKPVKPVKFKSTGKCLVAHKFDGIFGFVYSYPDRIVEFWEGNIQKVKFGVSLGDGFIFSVEKMDNDVVILLDVYQVRGVSTAFKESIFLDFLPHLELPYNYRVQHYCHTEKQLPPTSFKTDGIIFHNIKTDTIYKLKKKHTVDLVYWDGYFLLPNNQKVAYKKRELENGHVYEVSLRGRVIGERLDRFVGNSARQWQNLLDTGKCWKGPKFEERIIVKKKGRKRKE